MLDLRGRAHTPWAERMSHWCTLQRANKEQKRRRLKGDPPIIILDGCFTIFVNFCPFLRYIKILLNYTFVLQKIYL